MEKLGWTTSETTSAATSTSTLTLPVLSCTVPGCLGKCRWQLFSVTVLKALIFSVDY